MDFQTIANIIISISALCLAITNIYNFIAKPSKKYNKRKYDDEDKHIREILTEELPTALESHDLQVHARYLQDRYKYLLEIKNAVLTETKDALSKVETSNLLQNETIQILVQTSKDVLRQRIMTIYHGYKKEKRFPLFEKEALDELYKDYKSQGGNSYIDKYYGRMKKWEVYDDDDYEE